MYIVVDAMPEITALNKIVNNLDLPTNDIDSLLEVVTNIFYMYDDVRDGICDELNLGSISFEPNGSFDQRAYITEILVPVIVSIRNKLNILGINLKTIKNLAFVEASNGNIIYSIRV